MSAPIRNATLAIRLSGLLSFGILLGAFSSVFIPAEASAITTASFQPGHIIDDAVFTNKNAMSVQEIQNFLNAKVPSCDTWGAKQSTHANGSGGFYSRAQWGSMNGNPAPYTCLRDYVENRSTKQHNFYTPGTGVTGGVGAAQIIWDAAQAYNINPQVILTTLQKEQGLITDDWPWYTEYRTAMGYGCPDTADCDTKYFGFFNQVDNAAWQFRYYLDHPGSYNYTVGDNFVRYNPQSSCGGTVVHIENMATAALYIYTPYQPNQAALNAGYGSAPPCGAYGNRNFWLYYNEWFGSTLLPRAFKSASNPIVYLYVSGYKLVAPSMGLLQDYGISPQSIQTIDQSTLDSIPAPTPADGISNTIGYLVKSPSDSDADGGSIYYVTVGKKYRIWDMDQFNRFGFNAANISYLPLGFIQNFSGAQILANMIVPPNGAVFYVSGGQKHLVFDNDTYRSLNPNDLVTYTSYYGADLITSGNPKANKEILVKYTDSAGLYLLLNDAYYAITTSDAYNCWGFNSTLRTPLFEPISNAYLATINPTSNLTCSYADSGNTKYILSRNQKFQIPNGFGVTPPVIGSDLLGLASKIPTATNPLKQYIKGDNGDSIWYIESGNRKHVPSYSNFQLLGLSAASFDTVSGSSLSTIPASGIKLGNGQVVKTPDSSSVFVISGNTRAGYIRGDDYIGYGNSWSSIETYPTATLDALYPYAGKDVSRYLYDSASNRTYLADPNACYYLDASLLTSYGLNQSSLASAQTYNSSIFPGFKVASCKPGSVYVKDASSPVVYWIDGGVKHPVQSWSTLVAHSHSNNPYIVPISAANLSAFPTDTPL